MRQTAGCKNKGFTLIEMTVVLVIASIIIALGLSLAKPFFAEKQKQRTVDAVKTIEQAMADYFAKYGNYPCPAPLTTQRNDAADGRATDCNVAAIPAGVYEVDGRNAMPVRIGTIPYRDLEIPVDATIDAQLNRLTYAVSVPSVIAYDDSSDPAMNTGAIDIVDGSGNSLLDIPGTAHFFYFSHGRDGKGAFTEAGVPYGTACGAAGSSIDSENCDFADPATADATFAALRIEQLGTGATYYDDVSTYSLLVDGNEDGLWQRGTPNTDDIYNLNDEAVIVGGTTPPIPNPAVPTRTVDFGVYGDWVGFEVGEISGTHYSDDQNDGVAFSGYRGRSGGGLARANDRLASFQGRGAGVTPTTGSGVQSGAGMRIYAESNFGPTSMPSYLTLNTVVAGQTGSLERMRINSIGNVGIGTPSPRTLLDVNGEIKISSSAIACSGVTEGAQRYNTGTNKMEFCDGSNWISFTAGSLPNCANGQYISFNAAGTAVCVNPSSGVPNCASGQFISFDASGQLVCTNAPGGGLPANCQPGDLIHVSATSTLECTTPPVCAPSEVRSLDANGNVVCVSFGQQVNAQCGGLPGACVSGRSSGVHRSSRGCGISSTCYVCSWTCSGTNGGAPADCRVSDSSSAHHSGGPCAQGNW